MSQEAVKKIILRAILDPEFKQRLLNLSDLALQGMDLTVEEIARLKKLTPEAFDTMVGGVVAHQLLPIRVSPRVLVSPEWINPPVSSSDILIRLDQGLTGVIVDGLGLPQSKGLVFGSGTHPTTQLALKVLEDYLKSGDRVLDLGTGSGILAIAAAKLGAGNVLALDLDEDAVRFARHNVEVNAVQDIVRVEGGSIDWLFQTDSQPSYDLIIVNITALTVINLLQDGLVKALSSNGTMIFGGFYDNEVSKIEEIQKMVALKTVEISKQDAWVAMIAQRYNLEKAPTVPFSTDPPSGPRRL